MEASQHVKPEIERLLSNNYNRRWPSWEAIRLRRPRAVATKLACIVKTKEMARSKSASSLTFAARASMGSLTHHKKSSCHEVKDFRHALFVDLILWRQTSRICQALTWAESTSVMLSIPSLFASTKRVIWLSRSTASGTPTESSLSALPLVPCCGSVFQQFSQVSVSQCSRPRSSESERMWTTPRGSLEDHLSAGVSCPSCSCSSGQLRAQTCRPAKTSTASSSFRWDCNHRSPTPQFSAV